MEVLDGQSDVEFLTKDTGDTWLLNDNQEKRLTLYETVDRTFTQPPRDQLFHQDASGLYYVVRLVETCTYLDDAGLELGLSWLLKQVEPV